jgi:hypothetical protein
MNLRFRGGKLRFVYNDKSGLKNHGVSSLKP